MSESEQKYTVELKHAYGSIQTAVRAVNRSLSTPNGSIGTSGCASRGLSESDIAWFRRVRQVDLTKVAFKVLGVDIVDNKAVLEITPFGPDKEYVENLLKEGVSEGTTFVRNFKIQARTFKTATNTTDPITYDLVPP